MWVRGHLFGVQMNISSMNNDQIFLYWDTYETPKSGSIENEE